jgi:hypothetical protein
LVSFTLLFALNTSAVAPEPTFHEKEKKKERKKKKKGPVLED